MSKDEKLSSKNVEKISILYEQYKCMMRSKAYEILNDKELAEDAVHQTFYKIMDRIDRVDISDPEKTKSFLKVVCRNVALDMYRKMRFERTDSDCLALVEASYEKDSSLSNEPFDLFVRKESEIEIMKKLNELPEIYRDVLELECIHDYSKKEVAKLLNITYDTVKKRSLRGRRLLSESITKEGLQGEEGNCKQNI